jgi:hypothetical protein
MLNRMELVSLGIAAFGGIVTGYATIYEPINRNVALWLGFVGAVIILFAPWFYAQQKYWEEDAAKVVAAAKNDLIDFRTPYFSAAREDHTQDILIPIKNQSDVALQIIGTVGTAQERLPSDTAVLESIQEEMKAMCMRDRHGASLLPPKDTAVGVADWQYNVDVINRVMKGQSKFFAVSVALYEDSAGGLRSTVSCHEFDPARKMFIAYKDGLNQMGVIEDRDALTENARNPNLRTIQLP